MANYQAIKDVIELFKSMDSSARFDMGSWTHSCGAPSCIAGYTVAQKLPNTFARYTAVVHSNKAFDELWNSDLITSETHDNLKYQLELLSRVKLGLDDNDDDLDDLFPKKAAAIFGIDEDYAYNIFYPGGDYWDGLDGSKPKHAVKALKALLKDLKDNDEPDTNEEVSDDPTEVTLSLV